MPYIQGIKGWNLRHQGIESIAQGNQDIKPAEFYTKV